MVCSWNWSLRALSVAVLCVGCSKTGKTAAVESTCPWIPFSSTVHQQAVCMCPQVQCVSVGHHYTPVRQHSFTIYQQAVFVCWTYMFPSAASFGNYGRDSVLFFTGWNVSNIWETCYSRLSTCSVSVFQVKASDNGVWVPPCAPRLSTPQTLTLFQWCRVSRKGSDPHVKKERGSSFTDLT